ncbi:hypothetical protein K8R43_00065 [archaeon]|nr:hypothetical protein [archaeon]
MNKILLITASVLLLSSAFSERVDLFSDDFSGGHWGIPDTYYTYNDWIFSECTFHTEGQWTSCFEWDTQKGLCNEDYEDGKYKDYIACNQIEPFYGHNDDSDNILKRCCTGFWPVYWTQVSAESQWWHLRLRGNGQSSTARIIDTSGYKDIEYSFHRSMRGLKSSNECLYAYFSFGSSPEWIQGTINSPAEGSKQKLCYSGTSSPNGYGDTTDYTFTVSADDQASNNPDFMINFTFTGQSWDSTAAFIDDVSVSGNRCGTDGEVICGIGYCGCCPNLEECPDGFCREECCNTTGQECSINADCCAYPLGGCDDEHLTCFACSTCSGVEHCSDQEQNECESQCGASSLCDDLEVDSYWNESQICHTCEDCVHADCSLEDSCTQETLVTEKQCTSSGCTSGNTLHCSNLGQCEVFSDFSVCGGRNYYCTTSNGSSWAWFNSTNLPTENCNDGVDNDCDGWLDGDDASCGGVCVEDGQACGALLQCCSQVACCDGLCCFDGEYCCGGNCQLEPCCKAYGKSCSGAECCSGMSCCEGFCGKDTGEECSDSSECCSDYCSGGVCLERSYACMVGETRDCLKQEGVCAGSLEYCTTDKDWQGCDYFVWSSDYQQTESECADGLDNDCDGLKDEMDSDCKEVEKNETNTPPEVILHELSYTEFYVIEEESGELRSEAIKLNFTVSDAEQDTFRCYYQIDGKGEWVEVNGDPVETGTHTFSFGIVPMGIPKKEKEEHFIRIKCGDGINETESEELQNITLIYSPETGYTAKGRSNQVTEVVLPPWLLGDIPTDVRQNLDFIIVIILACFFIVLFSVFYYTKRKTKQLEEKIKKGKEKESFEDMEETKKDLLVRIQELKRIEIKGLSSGEYEQKKAFEHELLLLGEKLLKNKHYVKKLSERTNFVLQQSKDGISSKEIIRQLIKDGYSPKEIKIIKKAFKKRK